MQVWCQTLQQYFMIMLSEMLLQIKFFLLTECMFIMVQ